MSVTADIRHGARDGVHLAAFTQTCVNLTGGGDPEQIFGEIISVGVTFGTSILFGLTPALETSRPDLVTALKEDTRTAAGGSHRRVLAGLVLSEVAVAVVLVTGAGLLLKTFERLQELRVGFDPSGVITFSVNPPPFTVLRGE